MKLLNWFIVVALVPVIVFQGQGCTGSYISQDAQNASSGYLTDDGIVNAKAVESYKIVNVAEVRQSVESVLGITLSSGSFNRAGNNAALYSTDGSAESITAPMWVGFINLSGDGCAEMINKEKALDANQRVFFKNLDFKRGPASQNGTVVDSSIRSLARAAWARNETSEELNVFKSELAKAFPGDVAADTQRMALVMCTGVLAALEANVR